MSDVKKLDLKLKPIQVEETLRQTDQQLRQMTADRALELGNREQWEQEHPQEHQYYQKQETAMTSGMDDDFGELQEVAQPVTVKKEGHFARKKREEREKNDREALESTIKANQLEGGLVTQSMRYHRTRISVDSPLSEEEVEQEKKVLAARLEAIALNEKVALDNAKSDGVLDDKKTLEIKRLAMNDRVAAMDTLAKQFPLESKERTEALEKKEELQVQANELRQKLRIMSIADPVERAREEKTFKRHGRYDTIKKLFRKDNPFSREEAVYNRREGAFINKGRAFFGGTKFMYIMENLQETTTRQDAETGQVQNVPQQYLYKEATNCVGQYKPSGALVTEAASKLQKFVCGEKYSIPAWAVRDGTGKVVGSLQKKIDKAPSEVDLFSWQVNANKELPQTTKDDLLREHTLDWVLCNFDTKGENFLMQENERLISFDKEASFNHLGDEEAQHMSTDYKPHANDTIYNTLFKAFVAGTVTLDLSKSLEHIQKMESMTDEAMMGLFRETLTQRYGEGTPELAKATEKLLQRKNGLREEYRKFYSDLLKQRKATMAGKEDPVDYNGLLDENGKFRFGDEAPT